MSTHKEQIVITRVLLGIVHLQARLLSLVCRVFYGYTTILIRVQGRWMSRQRASRGRAVAQHTQRGQALVSQLQRLNQLPEARRAEVLADRTAWRRKSEVLKAQCSAPVLPATLRMALLTAEALLDRCQRRRRKLEILERIIGRVGQDTFCGELLLWFLLPADDCESLLGDLTEEFQLQQSAHGVARARRWYRRQVTGTLNAYFWSKLERLAIVGTLTDLFVRWFRK